jgi:hypothetical protein
MKIRVQTEKDPTKYKERYMVRNHVLLYRNDKTHPYWKTLLLRDLEYKVIKYVHTRIRHQGTDKCMHQISHSHRKLRMFVAHCDVCEHVKHPNRGLEIISRSHLPPKLRGLLTIDLYGPLSTNTCWHVSTYLQNIRLVSSESDHYKELP